jgi:ankyrin repeat protein
MKKNFVLLTIVTFFLCGTASAFGQDVSNEAQWHFDLGTAATNASDYAEAIREFEQAVKLAPDWPEARYNLAFVQEQAVKIADAIASYKEYLKLAPNADDAEKVKSLVNKLEYEFEQSNVRNNLGETPLHEAVKFSQKEKVELLIAKGADIEAKDSLGMTPLHWAFIMGKNNDIIEVLIAKGANINARLNNGKTLLHDTRLDDAKLLIAMGADVNATDRDGKTPLHVAAFWGRREMAELLIANGANVNAKDNDGRTPLQETEIMNKKDVADLLRRHGAK